MIVYGFCSVFQALVYIKINVFDTLGQEVEFLVMK